MASSKWLVLPRVPTLVSKNAGIGDAGSTRTDRRSEQVVVRRRREQLVAYDGAFKQANSGRWDVAEARA